MFTDFERRLGRMCGSLGNGGGKSRMLVSS